MFQIFQNLYQFTIKNRKNHFAAQPVSIEFIFFKTVIPIITDHTAFALASNNRLIFEISAGKRQFDLM